MVFASSPDELPQVEPSPAKLDLAATDAGHVQQVVHEARQVRDLPADDLLRAARRLAGRLGVLQDVEGVPDGASGLRSSCESRPRNSSLARFAVRSSSSSACGR